MKYAAKPSLFVVALVSIFFQLSSFKLSADPGPLNADSAVSASVPATGTGPSTDSTPPTTPILVSPADGFVMSDTTPEFVWKQASDPNSNTIYYTFLLNGVATHLGISNIGNSAGTNYTARIDDGQVYLSHLEPLLDGPYNWQVVAYDLAGNLAYSTTWRFVIDTVPPPITITNIDSHHDLNLTSLDPSSVPPGLTFAIAGPKTVYLDLLTEEYTNVTLVITDSTGAVISQTSQATNHLSALIFSFPLDLGLYTLNFSATDHTGLVSVLPPFLLNVFAPTLIIPIPGVTPPLEVTLPPPLYDIPSSLYYYPATISRIASRPSLTLTYLLLLALVLVILLILLKKRWNLALYETSGQVLTQATITHSFPNPSASSQLVTRVYALKPKHLGKLYLSHLGPRSTLTIEQGQTLTYLCLSANSRHYTITLAS